MGLGDLVWDMFSQKEPINGIVQSLKGQGHKVSYAQVARFLKNRVREMSDPDKEAADPALKENNRGALDLIATASMRNACMRQNTKAKMLSRVPAFREHFCKEWAPALFDCMDDMGKLNELAFDILYQCFKWTMADIDWMKVQRHEREVALKAVETRLKYSKELKAQKGARIVISSKDGNPLDTGGGSGRTGKLIQFKVKDA